MGRAVPQVMMFQDWRGSGRVTTTRGRRSDAPTRAAPGPGAGVTATSRGGRTAHSVRINTFSVGFSTDTAQQNPRGRASTGAGHRATAGATTPAPRGRQAPQLGTAPGRAPSPCADRAGGLGPPAGHRYGHGGRYGRTAGAQASTDTTGRGHQLGTATDTGQHRTAGDNATSWPAGGRGAPIRACAAPPDGDNAPRSGDRAGHRHGHRRAGGMGPRGTLSRPIPAMCGANQQPPQGSRQGQQKAGRRDAKKAALGRVSNT